ncbi:MAG: cytochrome c3 family protein [Paracoccus sp. (in: a-proteobacteria)]|nr:cytochrome c3 family protein [Paracoccus sp. (in: a-proteobacteria)]
MPHWPATFSTTIATALLAFTFSASAQTPAEPAPPDPAIVEQAARVAPGEAENPTGAGADAPYALPPMTPFAPDQVKIPNAAEIAAWSRSGHADAHSRSFTNWNEQGEIPPVCATCHSGAGFRALYGLDGSEPGMPEHPFPTGGVVDCDTCHNPGIGAITEISLPNGMMHPVRGGEASCLTCHQGRNSGDAIIKAIADRLDDQPDAELRFINPHYAVAAATWLGGYAQLGYEYPGRHYEGRFTHAKPVATCVSCHEPHSLEVRAETCQTCHDSGDSAVIRISRYSHDGSGDLSKGIKADIAANADRLKAMLIDYAAEVAGTPMIYNGERHPYFFADANADGLIDEAEGAPVVYTAWTPRLLKAAYNWKFVTADKGAHVHNPHYAIQLLYDSMEDLSAPMDLDFSGLGLIR